MSIDIKKVIMELSAAFGVSGEENCAADKAMEYLKKYSRSVEKKNGNVIAHFGERKEGVPHVLIDAHIDQIGLIVTNICESGFLNISNVGGVDRRLLPAQEVTIHGKKNITGIICSTPPHLSVGDDKVSEIGDFYIDTGLSFEEVSAIVSQGDKITFNQKPYELINNRITGPALDDRCGVAAVIFALENLSDYNCSFSVVFSTQEELGERGAMIAAFEINPDIAIAVDVSFAYCCGDKEYECGKMGEGPMIGVSPSLSGEISDKLMEICKKENIPFQKEVMNGLTSTNADRFSVNRCGCKACTVSIPLKYMHTPSEIIQIDDVENTGRLIATYLRSFENV